jgi:hypothetical protein
MSIDKFKDEPSYKQYLSLQDEPNEHIGKHVNSREIDSWGSTFLLKHRVLRNARKLKREFQ